MAALRTEEANISTKILKAKPMFVGQIDGNTELNNKQNDEIAEIIKKLNPDVVFTHWPIHTHQNHQIASLLTLNTWVDFLNYLKYLFDKFNKGTNVGRPKINFLLSGFTKELGTKYSSPISESTLLFQILMS